MFFSLRVAGNKTQLSLLEESAPSDQASLAHPVLTPPDTFAAVRTGPWFPSHCMQPLFVGASFSVAHGKANHDSLSSSQNMFLRQ